MKKTTTTTTTENKTTKATISIDEVKRALTELKLDSKFKVVYTANNEVQQIADIHLINSDKTLSSLACFRIGFRKTVYRFSSNRDFANCKFLKERNAKIDSHKRFEETLKDYNELKEAIKQACADYTTRHASKQSATKEKSEVQKKEA